MKIIDGKAVEIWGTEDVEMIAERLGYKLTGNEVKAILELMCKNYDASVGCNWNYIAEQIQLAKMENLNE